MFMSQSWFRSISMSVIFFCALACSAMVYAGTTLNALNPGNGLTGLTPNGGDEDDANGTAMTNLRRLVDMMVYIHKNDDGTGTINFPEGTGSTVNTYTFARPIRPLPNISFIGVKADGSAAARTKVVLKNTCDIDNVPGWNGQVIMAGWDQPEEGSSASITFRRINPNGGVWPAQNDSQIRVMSADYGDVNEGDEIKILSAANTLDTGDTTHVRPDKLFKAYVVSKTSVGGYWLYLDRQLPFAFTTTSSTNVAVQWGSLNTDQTNHPAINKGQPAWYRVTDWYYTSVPFWAPGTGNQHYGFVNYYNLGTSTRPEPAERYQYGFTSTGLAFKNMTLWSRCDSVLVRGMPCDSTFNNCILKGQKCIYGNSCINTTFQNCLCYFWDEAVELSYCCYNVTITNGDFRYDHTLNADSQALSDSLAIFNVNERSDSIVCNGSGLNIDLIDTSNTARTMYTNNRIFKISGNDCVIGGASTPVTISTPTITSLFRFCPQNDAATPPTNNIFENIAFDFNNNGTNNSFSTFCSLEDGTNYITFKNISFANVDTSATNSNRIVLGGGGDNSAHDCTFDGVAMPVPGASGVGIMNVAASFYGQNIVVKRSCTLNGYSGANLSTSSPQQGFSGTVTNTSTITLSN